MAERILIVDDEPNLLNVVEDYLKKQGYEVHTALSGSIALEQFHGLSPDFVILDLNLPDISGEEVCRIIRRESQVPILMLTAKTTEDDKVLGLSLGADDYLTKPFSPRELVGRVQAILRRTRGKGNLSEIYSFRSGDLVLDNTKRIVYKQGQEVSLTPNEYAILRTLMEYPGQVFTRTRIIDAAMGFDFEGFERTIDTHIKNLRQKIEDDFRNPTYIHTVYGVGYKFAGDKP